MDNAIDVRGLNKIYRNGFKALDNINLSIKNGDFLLFSVQTEPVSLLSSVLCHHW